MAVAVDIKALLAAGAHFGHKTSRWHPKMAPYIQQMQNRIAELLHAEPSQVNVKATTTERLGFTGREEGIAAMATILLIKK